MTDAIGAISSSTISSQQIEYEQVSPEDLAKFESEFKGEDLQFSPHQSIDEVKPTEFSDTLLQYIMKIDDGYHHILSDERKGVPKINVASESNALEIRNTEPDFSGLPFSNHLDDLMKIMNETYTWGIDVMAWSTHVKLLTNTITTTTGGLNSLLKSGGG